MEAGDFQPIPLQELGPEQAELKSFIDAEAAARFTQGEPLLSAACHLSLNDTKSAIQKLLLSNLPEFAYAIAKELYPSGLDQILVALFNKSVFYEQMSITNNILEQIQNRQLKEVLEASIYMSQGEQDGEIRNTEGVQNEQGSSTVFDSIIAQKIEQAVSITRANFQRCNSVSMNQGFVCVDVQTLEDHFFLSFIDLSPIQAE